MRFIKIMLLGVVMLYGINRLTQFVFGNYQLAKRIVKDSHITFREFQWTKDVHLFFDIDFSRNDEKELMSLYNGTIAKVKLTRIHSSADFSDYFSKKDVYNHILQSKEHPLLPLMEVSEMEKIEDYAQDWKMKYLWVFIDWIKLEDENKGLS